MASFSWSFHHAHCEKEVHTGRQEHQILYKIERQKGLAGCLHHVMQVMISLFLITFISTLLLSSCVNALNLRMGELQIFDVMPLDRRADTEAAN